MILKDVVFEDFVNFSSPAMYLIFPKCSFKCDRECGRPVCQNGAIAKMEDKDISIDYLVDEYIVNSLTHAIVCAGLEPFDSWEDLQALVKKFRIYTEDPIIIYTGYTEKELADKIPALAQYENIMVKFGRYVPDKESHMDRLLGVKLASPNQYAKWVSEV